MASSAVAPSCGDIGTMHVVCPEPAAAIAATSCDATGTAKWSLSELLVALVARQSAELARSGPLLELGCGISPALGGLGRAAHVAISAPEAVNPSLTVTDYNPAAIRVLEAANSLAECRDKGWQASARVLDWSQPVEQHMANAFSAVVASEVLYYNVDVNELLRAVQAFLRPGGVFLLASYSRGFSLSQLAVAAQAESLRLRAYDVHAVNEWLDSPVSVAGWCYICTFEHLLRSTPDANMFGIAKFELDLTVALADEAAEELEAEEAWIPFQNAEEL